MVFNTSRRGEDPDEEVHTLAEAADDTSNEKKSSSHPPGASGGAEAGRVVHGRYSYELGAVIGKGNDGTVVRAVNMETGVPVAIKILNRRYNQEDGMTEGDYMKTTQSKYIVKVEEVFRRGDLEYIVMELAEMDLLELVNALGSIDEDVARHFFRHLIHGVAACHKEGVAHLDIKPDNLVIIDDGSRNGRVKLTDFGLSAVCRGPNGPVMLCKACGSNGYASPEILKGLEPYDGCIADVWACGVVLFACTQGQLPWDDACEECIEYLWFKQGKFDYPANMSPGLIALLEKTLVCDPNRRATIQDIQQDEWFRGNGTDSECESDGEA